ncbi:unnamed protein product [Heterobilharzia americana]|nr:unnamed protein product [Heterobilharzia americana]
MSYSRSPQLLISSEALTTMDTNTNVTNSLSASVNPTAVPCGQCNITTNTQNPLSIKHNLSNIGYKPQLSHNVISKQQSSHTTSISSMIETNVHGNRGSINQYSLNEIHTLPRVIEQQSTTNYRPILISNTSSTNIGQLKGHTIANHITGNNLPIGNLTYQMIAYPRQALNIQQQQQQHGKSSHTISTGGTVTNSNNNNNNNSVMLAGVITPECLTADSSHNAARIAQLLAPSGTHSTTVTPAHITGNTQFLVYYPQHLNTGAVKVHSIAACPQTLSTTTVTPTLSAPMTAITTTTLLTNTVPSGTGTPTNLSSNHPTLISCKSTPSSTSIQSDDGHSQQPTTVYYTLATNDLIRQLKLSHQAIQIDSNTSPRQQIIQTPSGLMLIQYPQPQQQQQQQQQQQCPTTVNTAFQQHQQHGQNDNTLSRNLMTSSTLSAKHNAQIGVVGCTTGSLIPGNVDSNTLPRHARVEHVQGSSLICTCPPEVHQAIFEQQKKRQQKSMEQNQSAAVILGGITPFSKVGSTSTNTTTTGVSSTSLESTECGTATMSRNSTNLVTGVPKENGLLTKNITDKCQDDELINQRRNFPPYHLTNCTLNTLKTSGVQSDSFKEAFERIGLQVNNNTKLSLQSSDSLNKKQGILKTKLYEIEEIKKSIKSFYQIFTEFNTNCNEIIKLSTEYKRKRFFDLHLETIYNERECLNQSLQEIYKISSSITEQLYDLECIIEQTGNDVLQHRCRITLPYVQTLESRLESIHSTVSVTYGHYPEIQQLLNNREESERKAVEIQKRLLDEQLYQLKDVNEKCKRIKGTILTLKRLAIVNVQNRQRSNSPRRFTHLGGFVNRAAADRGSIERSRLYAAVQTIQPDSEKRLQAIKKQEMLAIQRRRVFSNENISTNKLFFTPIIDKKLSKQKIM